MNTLESNPRLVCGPAFARYIRPTSYCGVIFALTSLILALFSSCTTRPQGKPTLPALTYEMNYSASSPRSAPAPLDVNSLRAEDSPAITVTLVALRQVPANSFAEAESQTNMITVFPADKAVAPIAYLTKGARIGSVEDAEQFAMELIDQESNGAIFLQRLHGVLPPGITAHFRAVEAISTGWQPPEGFEVQIFRSSKTSAGTNDQSSAAPSLQVALVVTGTVKPEAAIGDENSEAGEQTKENPERQRQDVQITETIFLEPRPLQGPDRFVIILPSPFDTAETTAFAIAIDVRPAPNEDRAASAMHAGIFDECVKHLSGVDIAKAPGAGQPDLQWPGFESAIRALQSPMNKRRALLYLAEQTGASTAEDIAMSGQDGIVDSLCQAVTSAHSSGSVKDRDTLGWMLERSAYNQLTTLMSKEQITPEMEAILVHHCGQVGRDASTLEELTSGAAGIEEFERLVARENLIYLEDISPAARVRAFDWLSARGQAPEGYYPLASLKERRAALNRVQKGLD